MQGGGLMYTFFVCMFIVCFVFSIYSMINAYFPYDKVSRSKTRKFSYCKGILYGVLALVTLVDEFVFKSSNSLVPYLSIYIAIMEAVQNVVQSKADEFLEDVNEKLRSCQKNRTFKKDSEKLYIYCYQQISRLKSGRDPEMEQLVFEKVYDCLKYYASANNFLAIFKDYREKKCNYSELLKALEDWEEKFQAYGIEVVNNPEYE